MKERPGYDTEDDDDDDEGKTDGDKRVTLEQEQSLRARICLENDSPWSSLAHPRTPKSKSNTHQTVESTQLT